MGNLSGDGDVKYMQLALSLAEEALLLDEVPVGAVIVSSGEIISRGFNQKESLNDPVAHAEIIAIREAAQRIRNWRLTGATLYVTKEPCIMCCGAIVHARIKRVVYGCRDEKGGGAETLYTLLNDPRLNHRVEVTGGVCERECAEILRSFFQRKRS